MDNRPTMKDPKEFSIIRSMYFKDDRLVKDLDPVEENERMESRYRNKNKSSR